jgi:DNA-binding LacI/PurR family transcriptional regulator
MIYHTDNEGCPQVKLDRQAHTPLYVQFYGILLNRLKSISVGSNLPPERELCDEFNLDRVTVRKALSLLSEERYVERKQGFGTRVLRHPPDAEAGGSILFVLYHGAHLVDRLGEPFYARSMDALEKYLQLSGKRLVYSKLRREDNLRELCEMLEAQGVILAGTVDERMAEQCRALRIPLVGYNTRVAGFPSVETDNEDGAAISAQHLIAQGHKRIGFINVPGYINSEKRLSRFQSEMRKAGLNERALIVSEGDWSEQGGYVAAHELLSSVPDVTAIFGGNDSMAIGAMRAAQELGRIIPDDLSVVGFDGIAQSQLMSIPLTTSQVDVKMMAEATCMLLFHVMNKGAVSEDAGRIHAVVSVEFIARASTAAPRSFLAAHCAAHTHIEQE